MHHPECSKNETFVGNTHRESKHVDELKKKGVLSARMGIQAYDIDGKKLTQKYYAPLIVHMSDHDKYNDIMMTSAFGPNWRANR